jgi:hypothetical protein
MNYSKIKNPCEQHFDFKGEVCPVCQQERITSLTELFVRAMNLAYDAIEHEASTDDLREVQQGLMADWEKLTGKPYEFLQDEND